MQSLDYIGMEHIDRLELSYLCQILVVLVNPDLLTTLGEYFQSEMNTFQLPQGEMTIMLEDIYRILCIPFHIPRVVYDIAPRIDTKALWAIF